MKSLRAQLTVRLLCGGALLLAAAGMALDWQVRRELTANLDAALSHTAQYLTTLTEHKVSGVKLEKAGAKLPQFEEPDSADVFLLRTVDGREIQRSASLGAAELPHHAEGAGLPVFFDAKLADGRALRCAALRFLPDMSKKARETGNPEIQIVLTVGRDRAPLDHTLAALHAALLLVGAGALAGLAVLVRFGVSGALAPLDRLGEQVGAVDAASLATRFSPATLPAELQPIAERLNELLARLEAAFTREQRFTATAAHELRTPLAELRALAEVNLSTPATEDERVESWRDSLAITLRMEALALRLLELTRAEDPAHVVRRESVVLADAVASAWLPWADHGHAIDIAIPPGFTAQTDGALLAIVLGNLCGNAVAHAPDGAPLRVSAGHDDGAVALHFRNAAGGLAAADVPHLFERFWRKDDARSSGHHHGLGLALAAEFSTLLGGTLTARLDNGDVDFALRLPSA